MLTEHHRPTANCNQLCQLHPVTSTVTTHAITLAALLQAQAVLRPPQPPTPLATPQLTSAHASRKRSTSRIGSCPAPPEVCCHGKQPANSCLTAWSVHTAGSCWVTALGGRSFCCHVCIVSTSCLMRLRRRLARLSWFLVCPQDAPSCLRTCVSSPNAAASRSICCCRWRNCSSRRAASPCWYSALSSARGGGARAAA